MVSTASLGITKPDAAAAAVDGFETARLIIEYNSTDRDVGVQFHVDAEQWQQVTILDPSGHAIYTATGQRIRTLPFRTEGYSIYGALDRNERGRAAIAVRPFFVRPAGRTLLEVQVLYTPGTGKC